MGCSRQLLMKLIPVNDVNVGASVCTRDGSFQRLL